MVSKAINEGASIFLEKPISLNDLKYVWQYVYKKEINPTQEIQEGAGENMNHRTELSQGVRKTNGGVQRRALSSRDISGKNKLNDTYNLHQNAIDPKGKVRRLELKLCVNIM